MSKFITKYKSPFVSLNIMNDDHKVYEQYKQLRNRIRSTSIEDNMYVIWAYSQNLLLDNPIPPDIEVHQDYLAKNFVQKGLYPWDLEILAKETILNAANSQYSYNRHESFKKLLFLLK